MADASSFQGTRLMTMQRRYTHNPSASGGAVNGARVALSRHYGLRKHEVGQLETALAKWEEEGGSPAPSAPASSRRTS